MKLRQWLYNNRLTIKQFAELIDYERSYVHTWLSGQKKPSKKVMKVVRHYTLGKVSKFSDLVGE